MKSILLISLFIGSSVSTQPSFADVDLIGMNTMLHDWKMATLKKDAHAVAGFFTDDAVRVTPQGIDAGRQAIEQHIQAGFEHFTQEGESIEPVPIILTTDTVIRMGTWNGHYLTAQNEMVKTKGYWSAVLVRDRGVWKMRQETYNVSPSN